MPQPPPTEHRTIVVVDVADFTNPSRIVHDLMAVQEGLYAVLRAAFEDSGVDFETCATEDRGDGAMVLVPADVPKSRLADLLPDRLVAELRRYNATRVSPARKVLGDAHPGTKAAARGARADCDIDPMPM